MEEGERGAHAASGTRNGAVIALVQVSERAPQQK
jgi:hypothetical protein